MLFQKPYARTKTMMFALAVIIVLFSGFRNCFGAEAETTKWVLPVATAKANEGLAPQLTRLKDVLHNKFDIQYYEHGSPGCAFWVEVSGDAPTTDDGGYVVVIRRGGVVLNASDTKQLELAIDRIKQVCQVKPDGVYLPIGLLTNYKVIGSPATDSSP